MKKIKNNKKKNDINIELIKKIKEQFKLRMKIYSGKSNKTHLLKKIKKRIAQIKTFLNRRF
ncbi:MAG: 50S ribosomal protein L29 [Enterobacterales bacterium]